jgi:hypothetical protein
MVLFLIIFCSLNWKIFHKKEEKDSDFDPFKLRMLVLSVKIFKAEEMIVS